MVSRVASVLVCVLCVVLLPAVWADYCDRYKDKYGTTHEVQQCGSYFCCGTCENRGCCSDRRHLLSLQQQQRCYGGSSTHNTKSRLATLLGSILGSVFPIVICVGLIICCFAPCCFLYKKCRKGGNQGSRNPRNNTTVINVPLEPHPPASGYHPTNPGYQPVPAQPFGFGGGPSAPPPFNPVNPSPGMYPAVPYQPQPYAPTPFNPSYAEQP